MASNNSKKTANMANYATIHQLPKQGDLILTEYHFPFLDTGSHANHLSQTYSGHFIRTTLGNTSKQFGKVV